MQFVVAEDGYIAVFLFLGKYCTEVVYHSTKTDKYAAVCK